MPISGDKAFSTDGLGSPQFPPHGRAQWRIDGQVLRADVIGPFNRELAQLIGPILQDAFAYLVARGPCAELVVIRKSAMAGPEVLAALSQGLAQLVQAGLAPCATAFVMDADVEGCNVMPVLLARSYAAAGWPAFQVFATEVEAEVWIQAKLDAA
jgi:hypothetical protein